jgi:DNA-binding transcriptional ArsR family regulator
MIADPEDQNVHLVDCCYINLYNEANTGGEKCDAECETKERKIFSGMEATEMKEAELEEARERRPHVPKVKCRAIGAASDFLKAMSNPVRLSILCTLMEGVRTVGELEEILDVHQPTLSQQIGELREAGIITGSRQAKAVVYRLTDPRAGQIIGHLRLLFPDANASAIWRGAQFGPTGEPGMS